MCYSMALLAAFDTYVQECDATMLMCVIQLVT
jgi:hypothetical protein